MRHALAFLGAFILLVFAGFIVWFTRAALATNPWILIAPGLCIAFAFALTIPGDAQKAGVVVGGLAKTVTQAIRGANPPTGGTP